MLETAKRWKHMNDVWATYTVFTYRIHFFLKQFFIQQFESDKYKQHTKAKMTIKTFFFLNSNSLKLRNTENIKIGTQVQSFDSFIFFTQI